MNFSRLLPTLKTLALAFAADEVAAAQPYVDAAYKEVPDDIKADNPGAAFLATATEAWKGISADPKLKPSFTGLLGAVASAFINALTGS